MRVLLAAVLSLVAGAAQALTAEDLAAQGYRQMDCTFKERCLIGQPCERAWRSMQLYLNDDAGIAYRQYDNGRLRKGLLMLDARWKTYSEARAIVMPMREAVASHLTIFDGGSAVYSLQYAGGPGSGQFLRGSCEMEAIQ